MKLWEGYAQERHLIYSPVIIECNSRKIYKFGSIIFFYKTNESLELSMRRTKIDS